MIRFRTPSVARVALPCILVLWCSLPATGEDWLCDWQHYNGHQYRMTTPMTWLEADAQAVAVDGHLVTINDPAENQWLLETMMPFSPYSTWGAWIGLYQPEGSPEPDGGWQWISGEPLIYTNWDVYEPNNAANAFNEYVGEMYGPTGGHPDGLVGSGTWNDLPNEGYTGVALPGIVEVIPEPATLLLLALGTVAVSVRRRK